MVGMVFGLLKGVPGWCWVVAGLAFSLWWQTDSLDEVRSELVTAKLLVTAYETSQIENMETIRQLSAANEELGLALKADPRASAAAVSALTAERDRLTRQLDQERRRRQEFDRADPTCAAFSRARVCPALADRLRRDLSADRAD